MASTHFSTASTFEGQAVQGRALPGQTLQGRLFHGQVIGLMESLGGLLRFSQRFWFVLYALATFTGAFLVFQVQPVISKCVLPWFGGTPAVWTTCLLFFQVLLFFGYLYAHLSRQYLPRSLQGILHACLLVASAMVLPIEPSADWKPTGSENPTVALLLLLSAHVALPYFTLSSTGPMIQAWLSSERRDRSVYRLYALSNVGSLLALLSYPFLVEPLTTVSFQSFLWSAMFGVFAIVMGSLAIRLSCRGLANGGSAKSATVGEGTRKAESSPVEFSSAASWVLLPAFASIMLLAVTNHVCQDLAVVPFLWILPLSLYLLSFIITFDSPTWYRPKLIAAVTLLALSAVMLTGFLPIKVGLLVEAVGFFIALFGICTLCHGEVAAKQPPTDRLTLYYVFIALGGAIGGITIAIVCPIVFSDYRETALIKPLSIGLALTTFLSFRSWKALGTSEKRLSPAMPIIWAIVGFTIIGTAVQQVHDSVTARRNFFGVLRVAQGDVYTKLVHGRILHGLQMKGENSKTPTSYYGIQSGVGLALDALQDRKKDLKVGVVGLGCGVLAAYGKPGESWDFYEINADIIEIAEQNFTFLKDCPADIECYLGDGRLLLERAVDKRYDILIIDAFSSDSIPAHLLTKEAMELYVHRLAEDGVLAIHVSNNHLSLSPLVHRLAREVGLESRELVSAMDEQTKTVEAKWTLLTRQSDLWNSAQLSAFSQADVSETDQAPLWTDQYHNLLSVLRW